MDFNGKNIVLAVDDSLMVCKQIQTALKDEPVFLCEAHNARRLWICDAVSAGSDSFRCGAP